MRLALRTALLIATLAAVAAGQDNPNLEQGLKPFGSFQGGDIDSVSLTNGNLTIHAPLISFPQRGGKLRLNFVVLANSKGWYVKTTTLNGQLYASWAYSGGGTTITDDQTIGGKGQTIKVQIAPGEFVYAHIAWLVTADGAAHQIGGDDNTASKHTIDASGFMTTPSNVNPIYTITRDGIRYWTASDATYTYSYREDPNGNRITYKSSKTTGVPVGITDTLGRFIPLAQVPVAPNNPAVNQIAPGAVTSDLSGCPGGTVTAVLWNSPAVNGGTAPYKFCYATYTAHTAFNIFNVAENTTTQVNLINAVILPNQTKWLFAYDAYFNVASVTLPTGGTITYAAVNGGLGSCSGNGTSRGRMITARTVNANDGTGSHTWTYSWFPGGALKSVVTDPLGNDTVHWLTMLNGGSPYETETDYYQGASSSSANLLKTLQVQYSWTANPYDEYTGNCTAVNVVKTLETTIWPSGLQAQSAYTYDPQTNTYPFWDLYGSNTAPTTFLYGSLTSQSDSDYYTPPQQPPLLRKTVNTYVWQVSPGHLANNLLDLPYDLITQDGAGNKVAETRFWWDEYNLTASGITTQHDSAPPNGPYRGNNTSACPWRNTDNLLLCIHPTYYDTGTVYQSADPMGHTTTFSYSPSFAGAYVTQTQDPLGHTVSGNYDFNTGLLTSFTDQNAKTSSFGYDTMWRFTTASFSDGGAVNFYYPDAVTVERQQKIDATRWTDLYVRFDGLGREIRRASINDESSPYDQVDTCYDARGLVGFKSYPYQGTGFNQAAVCTGAGDSFSYDGLKRVTQVTHSDATTVTTSYAGRATRVTDEGNGTRGVQRVSQVDGLGRLASVCEVTSSSLVGITPTPAACGQDIAATGFLTSYAYDTLGNLTGVTQGGLNDRSFTYNSLSQLLSATNPEAGTTSYAYNNDGLLTGRTRPAPNQGNPATTVTATLGYDTGHRLTSETYSDGTPTVTINYDQASALGVPLSNTIGRKSSEYTTALGGATLSGAVFSYDAMGRVVDNSQCLPQNCGTGAFAVIYTYDYLGNLLSGTNGLNVTTSYSYNRAARLLAVTSSMADANHPGTLFSGAHYNALGALLSGSLGNGIAETRGYTGRGWLQSISATRGANTVYSLGMTYTGDGDVLTANDSVNGNWTYGYDDFNRLAASSQGSPATQAFSYGYDRFGNRWTQTATVGGGPSPSFSFDANNHSNDGSTTHDAAGNVRTYNDGVATHTYTYDAENRMTAADTSTYVYDAEGRRVKKVVSGSGWEFLYDLGGHVLTELGSAGVWYRGEVYAGGRQLATYRNGTTYFAHADWLGTQRVRTDVSGAPVAGESYQSLPFGDAMTPSTVGVSPNHFTGKERDSESGLDNFGARYYASTMGRFMSADPFTVTPGRVVDPQQLNLYAYVRNNPLKHIDPTGMLIDDAACKQDQKHCGKDWQKVQDIANQKDKNGNYTHPELQKILSSLQSDSRTFVIENSKLGAGTAGLFTITNFTPDGKDFTRATLQLDFKQIKGISGVTGADLVPGFNKYQGLLDSPLYRLAETFGHEGAHGLFGIQNPAQAVGIQQLLNQRDAAMQGQHYPYPPDVMQKMDAAEKGLIPTERFAQQEEKIINGELQADKKKQ